MKKGISLIALMATIAILMILISTVTISAISISNNSKKNAFAIELSLIQESVDSYKIRNNGEYPTTNTIVLNVSSVDEKVKEREFSNENIVDGKILLQKLDYEKIGITSLKYGNMTEGEDDVYAVSTTSGKVYYVRGLKIGGKVYFTLSSEISTNISKTDIEENMQTSGIIIKKSSDDWTNKELTVELRVPKEYKNISVVVDGSNASEGITQDEYVIYTLTGIKNNVIQISYKNNDANKTVKYTVDNYDNEAPVLKLKDEDNNLKPDQILIEDTTTKTKSAYMDITEKVDNLSKVKIIKYENDAIKVEDIKDYFANNGTEVKTNTIPIEQGVKNMTIYIEDNAGNYAYINNIVIEDSIFAKLLET